MPSENILTNSTATKFKKAKQEIGAVTTDPKIDLPINYQGALVTRNKTQSHTCWNQLEGLILENQAIKKRAQP